MENWQQLDVPGTDATLNFLVTFNSVYSIHLYQVYAANGAMPNIVSYTTTTFTTHKWGNGAGGWYANAHLLVLGV